MSVFGIDERTESAKGGEQRLSLPYCGEVELVEATNATPKNKEGVEWDSKHPLQIKFKTPTGETYTYIESMPKPEDSDKVAKCMSRIKLFLEVFYPNQVIKITTSKTDNNEAWKEITDKIVLALNKAKVKKVYGKIVGNLSTTGKPQLQMPKYGGFISTTPLSFSNSEITSNAIYKKTLEEAGTARADVSSSSSSVTTDSSLADLPSVEENSSGATTEDDLPF